MEHLQPADDVRAVRCFWRPAGFGRISTVCGLALTSLTGKICRYGFLTAFDDSVAGALMNGALAPDVMCGDCWLADVTPAES